MDTHRTAHTPTPTPITLVTVNIRGIRTKIQHIRRIIQTHHPDFKLFQETNIKTPSMTRLIQRQLAVHKAFWSLAPRDRQLGRGTAILQPTTNNWTVTENNNDMNGQYNHVTIQSKNKDQTYKIINIHGPPQVDTNDKRRFYQKFRNTMTVDTPTLLGGDFNLTTDSLDTTNPNRRGEAPAREIIQDIKEKHRLIDSYRKQHPYGHEYTFKKTRLDRFLIPDRDQNINTTHLGETLTYTDHKGVKLTIGHPPTPKTKHPRVWKF